MKRNYPVFFVLVLLLFSACTADKGDKPVPDYPPNETILKTFLWGHGSWWAYEDSTGVQDTFFVSEHYATNRNVFEGKTQIHSDYYYKGTLFRTKEAKEFFLEYISSLQHEKQGQTRTFINIASFNNPQGYGREKYFYTPWHKGDSIVAGSADYQGDLIGSYFQLLEVGDSFFYKNQWYTGKFYRYKIGNSLANKLADSYYTWQEGAGLVEYNIDGRTFRLVNHLVLKP